eukprot:GDKI01020546.1.p3 GENE.GDKI01020546.1~~GDKI01020546.1.p3  ORF type:complete len:123 (+),score=38.06 GDKI01020546.1:203-571(+)
MDCIVRKDKPHAHTHTGARTYTRGRNSLCKTRQTTLTGDTFTHKYTHTHYICAIAGDQKPPITCVCARAEKVGKEEGGNALKQFGGRTQKFRCACVCYTHAQQTTHTHAHSPTDILTWPDAP